MPIYSFRDIKDGAGQPMFGRGSDLTGQYATQVGETSTTPGTRYCIAVIDEDSFYTNAIIDARWAAFRAAWPNRPFFLLNPSIFKSGTTPIYSTTNYNPFGGPTNSIDTPPSPTGGYVNANGPLWIPGAAYSDPKFDYMPVSRVGLGQTKSNWGALTGVDLLPVGAKVGLFVDNSGSMTTSNVADSLADFQALCTARGIDIITVYNGNQNWIDLFTAMAGD